MQPSRRRLFEELFSGWGLAAFMASQSGAHQSGAQRKAAPSPRTIRPNHRSESYFRIAWVQTKSFPNILAPSASNLVIGQTKTA